MSIKTLPMTELLMNYIDDTLHFPAPLQKLIEVSKQHSHANMLTQPAQIQLIATLVKATCAKRIIEVGVFTGATTLAMALALPEDGKILACDIEETNIAMGRPYWEEANVIQCIEVVIAPAQETLDARIVDGEAGQYDFVYIDADKQGYPSYYERALTLVRSGGVILLDNLLWSGEVANLDNQELSTQVLRDLTQRLASDHRVDFSLLTQGDGLGLAYKH